MIAPAKLPSIPTMKSICRPQYDTIRGHDISWTVDSAVWHTIYGEIVMVFFRLKVVNDEREFRHTGYIARLIIFISVRVVLARDATSASGRLALSRDRYRRATDPAGRR